MSITKFVLMNHNIAKNIINNQNELTITRNLKSYKKNFKLFPKNSLLAKIYPSLLSKTILCESGDYWSYKFNINRLTNFQINPFRILRLTSSYFKILTFYFYNIFQRKKIICLLTRVGGMRDSSTIEDYRFNGLEKSLRNKNKLIYFIHGSLDSSRKIDHLAIFSGDINHLSKFIFLFIYPFLKFKKNFENKKIYFWHYDLTINLISTIIVSFFAKLIDTTFFWDFNYSHYPLFLGSYMSNSKLVGSLHNFHQFNLRPWISGEYVDHLGINYLFNDYETIHKIVNKNLITKYKNIKSFEIKLSKINIVIIQENQTDQESLIKFLASIRNKINKIYIKLRPDGVKSEILLRLLKKFSLEADNINDLYSNRTKDFIFIGTASTLLLELASQKRIAISFSNKKERSFDYPARKFVQLLPSKKKKINKKDKNIIENPIYISNKKDFLKLINNQLKVSLSNPTRNHIMFENHKIESILKLMSISE